MASLSRESLPAPPSLRLMHTNVSQPSISRTRSQQSLAASEDFYSLSSRSSNRSDSLASIPATHAPSRPHAERFVTAPQAYLPSRGAPSRSSYEGIATPVEVRQVEQPRITPMRGFGRRREDIGPEGARRTSPIRRKPVPSTVLEEASPRSTIRYTPTPIESSAMREFARGPSPPTPEETDTPYIRFALDQVTNDPNEKGERQSFPQHYNEDAELGPWRFEKEDPLRSHPLLPREGAISPPIPPRSARRSINRSSQSPLQPDHLVPFEPASDSFHEPLTALPTVLRPLRLALFIALLSIYLFCLIFTAIWSRVRTSLWQYGGFGDGRYFLWQYLPTAFAMALLLWLFEIQTAIYRLAPFMALTSPSSANSKGHAVFLPLSPSNFLLPSLSHLLTGQPIFTIFFFVSWLNLFTVPLLSSAFNVYNRDGQWVWLATQGVIWTAIVLYILLLASTIALLAYLHKRQTGLKWDARSMADLVTLVQASNTLGVYANYPSITGEDEVRERIEERHDTLGYFHSSVRPNEVFHTLGAPDRQARRVGMENRLSQNRSSQLSSQQDPDSARPYSNYSTGTHATSDPVLPQDMASYWQSHIPWFMRTTLVALWLIVALVLLIAFLVVSYLPSTRVSKGFLPELSVIQSNFGFSASNFLYSFIPSLLALLCLLLWQPFDLAFRRLQPYSSLSNNGGEVAEKSLLLTYTADIPLVITLKAFVNGHIRVALISLVTLVAATLPILAGGVFWSQFSVSEQRVRVYAHMPAYYALTFFFTLYCLSFALLFAGKSRRLPNNGRCLADLIALVHQSKLLDDPQFRAPATKISLVTRLLAANTSNRLSIHDPEKIQHGSPQQSAAAPNTTTGSKVSLADSLRGIAQARRDAQAETRFSGGHLVSQEQPRYGFGRYIGRDGREWLGIDKMGRPGWGGELLVRDS